MSAKWKVWNFNERISRRRNRRMRNQEENQQPIRMSHAKVSLASTSVSPTYRSSQRHYVKNCASEWMCSSSLLRTSCCEPPRINCRQIMLNWGVDSRTKSWIHVRQNFYYYKAANSAIRITGWPTVIYRKFCDFLCCGNFAPWNNPNSLCSTCRFIYVFKTYLWQINK